ncbi:hypothetical protein Y958_17080 [Nitrospirillum viridazoti CBAmc]|uniref:Uncharacterized protein n=1 Tax=Nitrospirillum viridazoti CBAmc TaxID=1441467 RepID=A0A248JV92_9PROT|nr:hypothetical protein Y958_17080 [Nitrospirillum amazonense CBAmc]
MRQRRGAYPLQDCYVDRPPPISIGFTSAHPMVLFRKLGYRGGGKPLTMKAKVATAMHRGRTMTTNWHPL